MLVGIIKEKEKEYYIHIKDNRLGILYSYNNILRPLSKVEAMILYNNIFSSKIKYIEKEDEYDIYLDENNHKRYFKNGLEDLSKFFLNNGKDGLIYSNKTSSDKNIKTLRVLSNLILTEYLLIFSLPLTFSTHKDIVYDSNIFQHEYMESSQEDITLDELRDALYNDSTMTHEYKDLLYNEELLKLVLKISSNNRNYSLREKFKKISIEYFSKDANERSEKISGYYNPIEPSTIYIRIDNIGDHIRYDDVLTHEFIHLLQTNNKYAYINEACAEIISSEYYGQVNNSYNEIVKRVKILMEIIGPKPVLECNFKVNTESFEAAISRYLNEKDKNELLGLFIAENIDLCETDEVSELNKKIDILLNKMYFNKAGKNIEEDLMINILSNVCIDDRIYFNQEDERYSSGYILYHEKEELTSLPLSEVIDSDSVIKYTWHKNQIITRGDKKIHGYTLVVTNNFNEIVGESGEFVTIDFTDGSIGIVSYDEEENNWSNEVERYKPIPIYAESILEKFPGQAQELSVNTNLSKNK